MHEVSLIESVVAMIEQERLTQSFARVRVVRLRVGALACAQPDALRFCFDAVTRGAIAEGARLEIETAPGEGWCAICRRTVPLVERFADCPICGSADVPMTGGGDIRLTELEVD